MQYSFIPMKLHTRSIMINLNIINALKQSLSQLATIFSAGDTFTDSLIRMHILEICFIWMKYVPSELE